MEYMDPETLNRFFYQNELVLRVSPDDAKTKVSPQTVRVGGRRTPCTAPPPETKNREALALPHSDLCSLRSVGFMVDVAWRCLRSSCLRYLLTVFCTNASRPGSFP